MKRIVLLFTLLLFAFQSFAQPLIPVGNANVTRWNKGSYRIDKDLILSQIGKDLGVNDTVFLFVTKDSVVGYLNKNQISVDSNTYATVTRLSDSVERLNTYIDSLFIAVVGTHDSLMKYADTSISIVTYAHLIDSANAIRSDLLTAIDNIPVVDTTYIRTDLDNHIADVSNPHSVTATQVGLGNVDNTSDSDKPISTATQTALDGKATKGGDEDGATLSIGTKDAQKVSILTNNSARINVFSSGNVAIGNSVESGSKLEVVGVTHLNGSASINATPDAAYKLKVSGKVNITGTGSSLLLDNGYVESLFSRAGFMAFGNRCVIGGMTSTTAFATSYGAASYMAMVVAGDARFQWANPYQSSVVLGAYYGLGGTGVWDIDNLVRIRVLGDEKFGLTSGAATATVLRIDPAMDYTGSTGGYIRGIVYDPDIVTVGGNTHIGLEIHKGHTFLGIDDGNTIIGSGTDNNKGLLQVVGDSYLEGTIELPKDDFNGISKMRGSLWNTYSEETRGSGITWDLYGSGAGGNGAMYWRLGSSGNVGNGTTLAMTLYGSNSRSTLQVLGRLVVDSSATISGKSGKTDFILKHIGSSWHDVEIKFIGDQYGSESGAAIRSEYQDETRRKILSFWTNDGTTSADSSMRRRMSIDGDGHVGIGAGSKTSNASGGWSGLTSLLHLKATNGYEQLRLETQYTPTGYDDPNGKVGDIAADDDNLYYKSNDGWEYIPFTLMAASP